MLQNIQGFVIISSEDSCQICCSFASALAGLAPNDIIQRTAGRLDSLHSEGVHVYFWSFIDLFFKHQNNK